MMFLRIAVILLTLASLASPTAASAQTGAAPAPSVTNGAELGSTSGPTTGSTIASDDQAPISASLAQSIDVDGPIEAGETVELTLALTHPAGADVVFPEAFEPARWSLIDAAQTPGASGEGTSTSTWVLTFGVYRPGATTLEPFDVTIRADGRSAVLTTEPVDVKVVSVLADLDTPPEFKPARPAVPVWVEDYTLAWLGGGFGLFALLGLLAIWAQRRKAMVPPPPAPPRKPHEIALEKLAALAADDLVERGEYMEFWVRLSETVREYLGRTYNFPPTELTTTEVLDNLLDVSWPSGLDLTDIRRFLRRCDEVKFGGVVPTVAESSEMLRKGFTFVELTRPAPAPDKPGEATAVLITEESDGDEDPQDVTEDPDAQWKPPVDASSQEEE